MRQTIAGNQLCDCKDAVAERREKASSSEIYESKDEVFKDSNYCKTTLRHRAQYDAQHTDDIYYTGYYLMDKLLDDLYKRFEKNDYNFVISFNPEDYRLKSDGIVGDYLSDQGPTLRLDEKGNAYYIQYGHEAQEGTYTVDGKNFNLTLRGINQGKALKGLITDSKKIIIPNQDNWTGEVFTKLY